MSVEYYQLIRDEPHGFLQRWFEYANKAEAAAATECAAATRIQRRWRGYRDRKYIAHLNVTATQIQRTYRGFVGRKRFRIAQGRYEAELTRGYYAYVATRIQKVYRGYSSRKRIANFYARGSYLSDVTEHGDIVESEMTAKHERDRIVNDQNNAKRREEEFVRVTENLHHLLSTQTTSGVLRSNIARQYDVTANQVSMETHIRQAFINRQTRLKAMRNDILRLSQAVTRSLKQQSKTDTLTATKIYEEEKQHPQQQNLFPPISSTVNLNSSPIVQNVRSKKFMMTTTKVERLKTGTFVKIG